MHTPTCLYLYAIRAQMRCTNNTLIVYIDDVAHVCHNHSDRIRVLWGSNGTRVRPTYFICPDKQAVCQPEVTLRVSHFHCVRISIYYIYI